MATHDREATQLEAWRDQIVGCFDPDLAEHGRAALDEIVIRIGRLEAEIRRALDELGVPVGSYPAPVAHAVKILRAAVEPDKNAGGRPRPDFDPRIDYPERYRTCP